jgi:hypothetical protein
MAALTPRRAVRCTCRTRASREPPLIARAKPTSNSRARDRIARAKADFFGEKAIARSNQSIPSKLFLDPYHVADGNLFAENFLMGRFQRGGQTTLAGRSKQLVMEKERFGKEDMQSRARSKYLEPEGGRFVPPLKPACSRDKGPDPYDTFKHSKWIIQDTGYAGGMGRQAKTAPLWNTHSLAKPSECQ